MTKKIKILSLIMLATTALFLNGCELEGNTTTTNLPENSNAPTIQSNLPENEVTSIMKSYAKLLKLKESDIKEENFYWYNYTDIDDTDNEILGYNIKKSGIKPEELPSTTEFFDGWQVNYIGDEIGGSVIDYQKDNIICSQGLFYDQEIPYELMVWEGEDEDYDEEKYNNARDEFSKTITYSVDLSCGFKPEGAYSTYDFYFDAEGMEPFWSLSIRGSKLTRFDPEKINDYYVSTLKKDGENIHFEGYNIEGDLTKEACIDGGKGDTHEYKIQIVMEGDMVYEGCADKYDADFVIGEEGTLGNLVKKTNYQYKGNYKRENVSYDVFEMINNYVQVGLYEVDGENYNSTQLIMEKTDNGRKVLYEGDDYEVDYDKCEELLQYDNNLMEMFFLVNCPRG